MLSNPLFFVLFIEVNVVSWLFQLCVNTNFSDDEKKISEEDPKISIEILIKFNSEKETI